MCRSVLQLVGCLLGGCLLAIGVSGCGAVECFRAVQCVERCGGPVVQNAGCGACRAGLIDSIRCVEDAGPDGGGDGG